MAYTLFRYQISKSKANSMSILESYASYDFPANVNVDMVLIFKVSEWYVRKVH